MNLDALLAMLRRHEDERLTPYDDATGKELRAGDVLVGNITIAIGCNLSAGISPAESQMLTESRLDGVLTDLEQFAWWDGLSERRQEALADMRFNLGPDRFREFKAMIHALAVKDYAEAARQMLNSAAARALPRRYAELAQMLEQG